MSRIPLIRASQAAPFLAAVDAAGTRTTPLLEAVGIAPDLVEEDPEALVPEYAIWELVDRCAAAAGSEDFGWSTGLGSPIGNLGAFGQRIDAAPTLGEALDLFLRAVSQHSSHARFSVVRRGDAVWFCRHGIDSLDVGAWQVELYVLGVMVHVTRLALGPDWAPTRVTMKLLPPRGARMPAALREAQVRYGARVTAIELPTSALREQFASHQSPPRPAEPIELEITEAVRLALRHALPTGLGGLAHTARLAGVTPRTLQRWLKEEGKGFEDVLEEMRREEAFRMLGHSTASVAKIAGRLGYGDPSNFTRAFRRWTGRAPSEYRAALR